MCEYIRAGAADPQVQAAADYAWRHFGLSSDQAAVKAWAVFWYVKHCVKFRVDEATMFRIGEENQQDILIAPAVLARMKDPAEDCDGFAMLTASMLQVLGVPVVVATVAADPREPERWSHVFPCALLPAGTIPVFPGMSVKGGVLPLDASHGVGPGWMVPLEQMFRWQAWSLDGQPTDVAPSKFQGLHGYVRSARPGLGATRGGYRRLRGVRGLGQDEWTLPADVPAPSVTPDTTSTWGGGQMINFGAPAPSSFNLTSLLNNLVSTAGSVARIAVLPTGATVLPSGQVLTPGSSYGAFGSISGSSMLLPIGLGLGLLLLVSFASKGRG